MTSYKTQGIVLRRVNYGEADRIITFMTPDSGKVAGLAKGVRKLKSKLAGHLEPFNEVELMFARGKSLDILTSARVITQRPGLSGDYERLRRAFLVCEMCDRLTQSDVEGSVYGLLNETLAALETQDPRLVELYFKLKLLDYLGYRPNLEQCMESRREITAHQRYRFSPMRGGLIEHGLGEFEASEIGSDHIKLWRLLLANRIAELARVGNAPKAAAESLPLANDFYEYLFGKRFRSEEI